MDAPFLRISMYYVEKKHPNGHVIRVRNGVFEFFSDSRLWREINADWWGMGNLIPIDFTTYPTEKVASRCFKRINV